MTINDSRNARQSDFYTICVNCESKYDCCRSSRPPIIGSRKTILTRHLEERGFPVEETFVSLDYTFPREKEGDYCIFHDPKKHGCLVHDVKPETCVAGPITFDINVGNGKIEWFIKTSKICRLAPIIFANEELLETHLKSAKTELLRLVNEIDSTALRAILRKSEPDTFKIGQDDAPASVLDKLTKSA